MISSFSISAYIHLTASLWGWPYSVNSDAFLTAEHECSLALVLMSAPREVSGSPTFRPLWLGGICGQFWPMVLLGVMFVTDVAAFNCSCIQLAN